MSETKSCNICTEDIKSEELVTLICNPNHHFCYTCIFDWYNIIKNNTQPLSFGSINTDNKQCTCPICKKDGGELPLLPPHTEKILGIHIKGKTPYIFGMNSGFFGGVAGSKCDHKDCNFQYSHINVHSKNKLYKNLCYTHFYDFKKGKNLILENDILFESSYIQCNCKMPNGTTCTITSQNMSHINLNNKKYYLCNSHLKLHNHNIEITFDDNVKVIFKPQYHFVKNVCCTPNKSKYGYCLNYINSEGLCKTQSHNKNIVKNIVKNEPFNDSDFDEIFEPSETTTTNSTSKKVMSIHIGLCGVALKNGNGNCQNKGKALYNGKCGVHKNC